MNFREGAEGRNIRFICLCGEKLVVDMLVKKKMERRIAPIHQFLTVK